MFGFSTSVAAVVVGLISAVLAAAATRRAFFDVGEPVKRWHWWAAAAAGLINGLFVVAILSAGAQRVDEVRPTEFWMQTRILTHSLLILLLIAATATDLDSYYIPDSITIAGILFGLIAATFSGDLQVIHVWVDWNEAIPQIRGPYLPAWMSVHPHLHGFVWSMAGIVTGMGLTWGVRVIASRILGIEALGFGDVMLMGMVGSFLGWQPTVVAFLLAPLAALTIGVATRLIGGKSYIPYGPYLALGSLVVMFGWRWIWMFEFQLHEAAGPNDRAGIFSVRRLFGDWVSLAALAGIMVVGLILLLGMGRLYRMIPGRVSAIEADGQVGQQEKSD